MNRTNDVIVFRIPLNRYALRFVHPIYPFMLCMRSFVLKLQTNCLSLANPFYLYLNRPTKVRTIRLVAIYIAQKETKSTNFVSFPNSAFGASHTIKKNPFWKIASIQKFNQKFIRNY